MVEPQSCVQNVHIGGKIQRTFFSPAFARTNKQTVWEEIRITQKNPLSKWNCSVGESDAAVGSEAVIHPNSNQILNVSGNRLRTKNQITHKNGNIKKERNAFIWLHNADVELVPRTIDSLGFNLCWIQNKCKFLNQSILEMLKWAVNQKHGDLPEAKTETEIIGKHKHTSQHPYNFGSR